MGLAWRDDANLLYFRSTWGLHGKTKFSILLTSSLSFMAPDIKPCPCQISSSCKFRQDRIVIIPEADISTYLEESSEGYRPKVQDDPGPDM